VSTRYRSRRRIRLKDWQSLGIFVRLSLSYELAVFIICVPVDVAFLTVLFEHRRIFHRIAAQSLRPELGTSGAIVCWVDTILSKLGDATVAVASGLSLDLASPFSPGSTEFRAEDGLRAASQLPCWSMCSLSCDLNLISFSQLALGCRCNRFRPGISCCQASCTASCIRRICNRALSVFKE
jgi:hypothetical protein